MTFSMTSTSLPSVRQMFSTLDFLAKKGAETASEREIEEAVLLNWRLAPDMFPLVAQFQLATEIPARGLSRLAGSELPSFDDDEASFAEVRARITAALSLIEALPKEALDADPTEEITVPMGPQEMTFGRSAYLQGFVLPNLFFHTTTAYLILRHLGVELGKRDFLSARV